jgi:hypothetical protein
MNVHLPYEVPGNAPENGMGRFFSPTNLGRYRSLVDDKNTADERTRVLKVLAEEWGAFMRECRTASAIRVGSRTSPFKAEIQGDATGKRSC